MAKVSGSCLCGNVSFEGDTEVMNVINCHCDDCRKATGAAYATNVFVKQDEITVTGTPKVYTHKSDRGTDMTKYFCDNCGGQVYGTNSAREGVMVIRAGTLDQKELTSPKINVYTARKFPATHIDPDCKNFETMPG